MLKRLIRKLRARKLSSKGFAAEMKHHNRTMQHSRLGSCA